MMTALSRYLGAVAGSLVPLIRPLEASLKLLLGGLGSVTEGGTLELPTSSLSCPRPFARDRVARW